MPPATPPPLPGDVLGQWTLRASLGVGGMAVVYRAEGAAGPAAVKVLHQARVTADEVKRFQREFITLDRLDHPNIVRVYEAGQWSGFPWIAMELVEGTDLGTLLERWASDPPEDRFARVEAIFAQICEALAYVHEHGVIHRDLKPGNVLVGDDGRARLSDFGVVKDPDAFPTSLTMAGRLVGTVAFMAPEQITGESPDARADLYSLGAILYVMLTGRRPIVADSIAGYLARHLTETPSLPSDLDPRVPARLERVCMRLLQKDPARRFASARQALTALHEDGSPSAPPIHGRDAVLDAILSRVVTLQRTRVGGVVALVGPVGSGRSRLLTEVVERARAAGVDTASAGPADTLRALDAPVPVGAPGSGLRARLGERPWLFVVDDVDDAPSDARAALAELVREHVAIDGGALLLVVVCRPGDAAGLVNGAATGLSADELRVGGLDRDAVRAMLRDHGVHGALGATLGRRLHEELDGQPGPILEQLDALVRTGVLTSAPDGALRATVPFEVLRAGPLPLPERVRAAESAVREALPPDLRDVLDALAVLAAPTALPVVAAVSGLSDPATSAALGALERSGAASRTSDALSEQWWIPSARRAQVHRECIDPARRAVLHRAAGDVLLRAHRRRVASIAAVAAHHLLAGGDPAGAYPLWIQAAQRAGRRAEQASARDLCVRAEEARAAAEAVLSPEEALRWRRQLSQALGEAERALGRLEEARRAFAAALDACDGDARDPAARGRALAGLGMVVLAQGRPREAHGLLDEAFTTLEQGDTAWPEVASGLALARFDAGDDVGAARAWTACVEVGADTHNAAAEMDGTCGLARLARASARHDEAAALLDRAVERGRDASTGSPTAAAALAAALYRRAEPTLDEGDWSRACRLADTIESLAESASDPTVGLLGATVRLVALDGLGERAAASRAARELLDTLRLRDARILAPWCAAVRVLADGDEAEDAARRLADPAWLPDPPTDAEAQRLASLALAVAARRPQAAREHARAALARPPSRAPFAAARVEIDAARALLRAGDAPGAAEAAHRALSRLDDRLHRALVIDACRISLATAASPEIAARLRRAQGRVG